MHIHIISIWPTNATSAAMHCFVVVMLFKFLCGIKCNEKSSGKCQRAGKRNGRLVAIIIMAARHESKSVVRLSAGDGLGLAIYGMVVGLWPGQWVLAPPPDSPNASKGCASSNLLKSLWASPQLYLLASGKVCPHNC